MNSSPQFRIFVAAVVLLFLFNILIYNDIAVLWSGPEAVLAWDSIGDEPRRYFPALVQSIFWDFGGGNLFVYRLSAVLFLLATAACFFFIARPLLGVRTTTLSLLVAGASLGLPQLAKVATPDSLLLLLHTMGWLLLLRFLKKPGIAWRLAFYAVALLSGLVHPFSTLIFLSIGPLFIYFSHPQGKRLWALQPWLAGLAAFALGWNTIPDVVLLPYFYRGPGYAYYLLLVMGGFLPFVGFLVAGLRDYLARMRKKDEMALVLVFWILAALMACSPALAFPLAILVARQMDSYFDPRYPFAVFVKTGAVLHLIAVFFGAMVLMLGGLHFYSGAGFRSGMAVSAAYWSMSFLGVIGLYGGQRRLALGGPLLAGLLAVLLFWVQVFPLLESGRRADQALLETIPGGEETTLCILYEGLHAFPNLAVYARLMREASVVVPAQHRIPNALMKEKKLFLIAPKGHPDIPDRCVEWKPALPASSNTRASVWVCSPLN